MELLLDTCTLLWMIGGDKNLPKKIVEMIEDDNNTVYISVSSLWEVEIKHQKSKQLMPIDTFDIVNAIRSTKINNIGFNEEHLMELGFIVQQNIHKDPFDHLLLAIAREEGMVLVTHDNVLTEYQGVKILHY